MTSSYTPVRPRASIVEGNVWLFVGGRYHRLNVDEAREFRSQLDAAIAQIGPSHPPSDEVRS